MIVVRREWGLWGVFFMDFGIGHCVTSFGYIYFSARRGAQFAPLIIYLYIGRIQSPYSKKPKTLHIK